MKARLAVAGICVPALAVILWLLPPVCTLIVICAMCALAAWEFLSPTGLVTDVPLLWITVLLAALVPIWCRFGMPYLPALIGIFLYFLAAQLLLLKKHLSLDIGSLFAAMYAGILIPFLLSALVRIYFGEDGKLYIAVPIVIAFVADGAALFSGMLWGKHKLAPQISPKKTVEGMLGGIVGAVLCTLLYCLIVQTFFDAQVHYFRSVIYALSGSLVSVVGDLCFSVVKRRTGIKDFGSLLPGHGGILDRFDSMVLTAPLIEILILLLPLYF